MTILFIVKKLFTRAITGSIYVAIIVIPLLLNSPYLFLGVFAIFSILGVNEFHNLVTSKTDDSSSNNLIKIIDILGGCALFLSLFFSHIEQNFKEVLLLPSLIYFVIRFIAQLYIKVQNPIRSIAMSIMSIVYIAIPIALLNLIYFEFSPRILLATFIFIWVNDTGAFCVGSLIGKHRLFEKVSPKKSWEGFWGGMIFCIATAFIFYYCNEFFHGPDLAVWIGFGIMVSVFATWGDLCESLIKRTLDVKDSGNILPGHGGMLDRIDSLLIVSPSILVYFMIIGMIYK